MSEYKRLTERWADEVEIKGCISCETPTCDGCGIKKEILNRLADLETKIEERRIIRIPCKVGDTIYYITGGHQKKTIPAIVTHTYFEIEDGYLSGYVTTLDPKDSCDDCWKMGAFGKRWFTTPEAAEARLKELEAKGK